LFQYTNGATLYYGGMKDDDQRESIRSIGEDGGLGIALFEEANAFKEDDYNEILGRMRSPAAPYRQIILMTNPDSPTHWINQRLIIGREAKVYYSGARDNPFNPPDYIAGLDQLTGTLYQRLVLGKWVQAEGVIYDNFDMEFNVTEEAEFNKDWLVRWGVDDGYAQGQGPGHESYHPRVILFGHITPAGGLDIFAEYYKTGEASYQKTIQDAAEYGYPMPEAAHIDSSAAMFKGALKDAGIYCVGATHKVSEGIKNVRQLICDGNGIRRLRIHPRCKNLIRELLSYRYAEGVVAQLGEPKPMKLDNHGPDSVRYMGWPLRHE
jgi:phage terminase large subunit